MGYQTNKENLQQKRAQARFLKRGMVLEEIQIKQAIEKKYHLSQKESTTIKQEENAIEKEE